MTRPIGWADPFYGEAIKKPAPARLFAHEATAHRCCHKAGIIKPKPPIEAQKKHFGEGLSA